MPTTLDYYFTPISPWTYLGAGRFAAMVQRHGVDVRVKPVDYGVIFPKTGGLPLAQRAKERQAYRLMELKRWSKQLGLPLTLQPKHFPAPDLLAACVILAAGESGGDPLRLANAIGRAVWVEERNIADAATLQEIAAATGHDGAALLAKASDPAIRVKRDALTQEALAAGVFGAPTYVVDGELFWGQDRLDFLERKLAER
jgi:2-hydroxychromene-2-carboxylate isomerase